MDPKYIFAIVALSLFFVLFIIFFAMLARKRRMEARLQAWLYEVYSDKNLIKMDYDSADEDEPVQSVTVSAADASPAQDEKKEAEEAVKTDELYGKIEIEGIEEITNRNNKKHGFVPCFIYTLSKFITSCFPSIVLVTVNFPSFTTVVWLNL